MFRARWLQLAEVLHFTQPDILALTLDDFVQAVEYTKGRLSNGG